MYFDWKNNLEIKGDSFKVITIYLVDNEDGTNNESAAQKNQDLATEAMKSVPSIAYMNGNYNTIDDANSGDYTENNIVMTETKESILSGAHAFSTFAAAALVLTSALI